MVDSQIIVALFSAYLKYECGCKIKYILPAQPVENLAVWQGIRELNIAFLNGIYPLTSDR